MPDTRKRSTRSPLKTAARSGLPKMLAGVLLTVALAACAGTNLPASVKGGECRVFEPPEVAVEGKTEADQRWIDDTVESGVGACAWPRPRPKPEQSATAQVSPAPKKVVAKKKPTLRHRIKAGARRILRRPVKPSAEAASPAPPVAAKEWQALIGGPVQRAPVTPPAPPRSDLDELLDPEPPR